MSSYYVIAEIQGLEDFYAVKEIDTLEKLSINDKVFGFDFEGTNVIYIGVDENPNYIGTYENPGSFLKESYPRLDRLDFSLSRYKTKINPQIYKVKLEIVLGRIAHGCKNLLIERSINTNILSKALLLEEKRLDLLTWDDKELDGETRKVVNDAYQVVEDNWLDFWKKSIYRLKALHKEHFPNHEKFRRNNVSALLFGKYDDYEYKQEKEAYSKKMDWLCTKLTDELSKLDYSFQSNCPGRCGYKIDLHLNHEIGANKDWVYAEESDFPVAIYRNLYQIFGSCPECGRFKVSFEGSKKYTCIHNWLSEGHLMIIYKNTFRWGMVPKIEHGEL